jgi:hypothetical protein
MTDEDFKKLSEKVTKLDHALTLLRADVENRALIEGVLELDARVVKLENKLSGVLELDARVVKLENKLRAN